MPLTSLKFKAEETGGAHDNHVSEDEVLLDGSAAKAVDTTDDEEEFMATEYTQVVEAKDRGSFAYSL